MSSAMGALNELLPMSALSATLPDTLIEMTGRADPPQV
jgi:hypothetical protein